MPLFLCSCARTRIVPTMMGRRRRSGGVLLREGVPMGASPWHRLNLPTSAPIAPPKRRGVQDLRVWRQRRSSGPPRYRELPHPMHRVPSSAMASRDVQQYSSQNASCRAICFLSLSSVHGSHTARRVIGDCLVVRGTRPSQVQDDDQQRVSERDCIVCGWFDETVRRTR
jgi:hypothetical protein